MEKRQFDDPLVQPALVWLNQFSLEKEWLNELVNAGLIKDSLTEADFYAIQGILEQLEDIKKRSWLVFERDKKLLFLFHCTGTMRFIDSDALEYERINALPLLFRKDGTFQHFVWVILEKIREYAAVNKNFDGQYRRILKKNRNGPIEKRMTAYFAYLRYPPGLIAELEGLPPARLDQGFLHLLYWGLDIYEAFYDMVRGGKKTMSYDRIPRRIKGSSAYLPFLGYAAMKRDLNIMDAVFEGMDAAGRIHCLADIFYRHDKSGNRRFKNWIDKAVVQDFFQADEDFSNYRPCEGMKINPSEVQMAKVFCKYAGGIIKKDVTKAALSAMRLFFPNAGDGTATVSYLDYIRNVEKAAKEYRQFVETIAEKAAACEPGLLFPPELFADYMNDGTAAGAVCDFIEAYLDIVKPDRREDIIPFAKFIFKVLATSLPFPKPLDWFNTHPRFAALIGGHIGDPDFLFRLLNIPGEVNAEAYTKFSWVNCIFTIWLLHVHGDKQCKTVWPARVQSHFSNKVEGPKEGGMMHKAAEILLSEGAIRKEKLLLDFIWNLFEEDECRIIDHDFIPYKYFVRVNEDAEKDRALLESDMDSRLKNELNVLLYLKTRESFDITGFILNHIDTDNFFSLPPEVFDLHQLKRGKIFWLYLKERGDTFERFGEIINDAIWPAKNDRLAGAREEADPYIAPYIDSAINESGDRHFELYKFLNVYCIAGKSINRMLDEQPEKGRALLERAGKHLALLRKIDEKEISPEERKFYYSTSVYAAHFVSEQSSPWKALKPFLLTFRNSRHVLLRDDLTPNGMQKENPAERVFNLLYIQRDEEKLKQLRRDMAGGIADFLKPLPSGDRGSPLDRAQNYSDTEKKLEGFDISYREPNPHWRYAYVRALDDLGVDTGGKGYFFHSLLNQVKSHDPSPLVRDAAGKTAEHLRNIRGGWEEGSHRRHLIQAFWWIRRAHMLTLNSPINDREALRTRNTEYR